MHGSIIVVQPETVLGWHHEGFRLYFHEKASLVKA
jgi:hypothetical protein